MECTRIPPYWTCRTKDTKRSQPSRGVSGYTRIHILWTRVKTNASAFFVASQVLLGRSLIPLGDRVLVQRAPKVAQTSAGLYLPQDTTKAPNEGKVIAVGPGNMDVTGTLHPCTLTAGDTVLLPEYGGTKVDSGDSSEAEGEMFLFRESDILGKFE